MWTLIGMGFRPTGHSLVRLAIKFSVIVNALRLGCQSRSRQPGTIRGNAGLSSLQANGSALGRDRSVMMAWFRDHAEQPTALHLRCHTASAVDSARKRAIRADTAVAGTATPRGGRAAIIVRLHGISGGVVLTDVAGGVEFDWDGDGIAERTSWTREGDAVAFLALDANGNGKVDGGFELVGPRTLEGSHSGFYAILKAGTHDGDAWLTCNDEMFPKLLLWTDTNHNGRCDSGEVERFSARVDAMALGFMPVVAGDKGAIEPSDAAGNVFLNRAVLRLKNGKYSEVLEVRFIAHSP